MTTKHYGFGAHALRGSLAAKNLALDIKARGGYNLCWWINNKYAQERLGQTLSCLLHSLVSTKLDECVSMEEYSQQNKIY